MLALAGSAQASTYTNPAPIAIDNDTPAPDAANPYPSTINVQGIEGTINLGMSVRLNNLSHGWPEDIDILLATPTGAGVLMSDTCGNSGAAISNQTVTFAEIPPFTPMPALGPCPTGTYLPTDRLPADSFPAPAPTPPPSGASFFSQLAGDNPNGEWHLFVVDDSGLPGGTIAGGWTLDFTAGGDAAFCTVQGGGVAPNITGTAGDDVLEGTPGNDSIVGFGGNDVIRGGGGNDYICGRDGNDNLSGGAGRDIIAGEAGKDTLKGGAGKDFLDGGPGKDKLKGQAGKDELKGRGGKDSCSGGGGNDIGHSCEKRKSL